MGTTYSWHQGTVRLKSKWAVPTPLLPDEIFSSWLVRVAFANGLEPMALTGSLWDKSRLWTIDIDRNLSQSQIATIAEHSGMSQQQIYKSLLPSVIDKYKLDTEAKEPAIAPWILALGSRNRTRYGGMQYCPQCLAEDETAYFRINWRFAWHTTCLKHSCVLLDRCPHCQTAIQFHKRTYQTPSMRHCAVCNLSLTEAPAQHAPTSVLQLQESIDQMLLSSDKDESIDCFLRLKVFESLVRRQLREQHQALAEFFQSAGIRLEQPPEYAPLGLGFELLSTQERLSYLSIIQSLMSMPNESLISNLCVAGVTKQAFCPNHIIEPNSLRAVINELPDAKRKRESVSSKIDLNDLPPPRNEKEVMRTFERLKRKIRAL